MALAKALGVSVPIIHSYIIKDAGVVSEPDNWMAPASDVDELPEIVQLFNPSSQFFANMAPP